MEWGAILYVSSGLTLTAFIAALAAWIVKGKSEEKEKLISQADNNARTQLIQSALEFFHVNTNNLTKKQQYEIAIEQIKNRAKKFKIIAFLVSLLTLFAAMLTAYAIYKFSKPSESKVVNSCDVPFEDRTLDCILNNQRS